MQALTLPTVTKTTPKVNTPYYTINIDRSAPKLHPMRVLRRVWTGSKIDQFRISLNNVFPTAQSAKKARANIYKALASN